MYYIVGNHDFHEYNSYHHAIILYIFYLGNKCFYIREHHVDSGRTYFDARDFCRIQRGIRSDLASFDNELENGMRLIICHYIDFSKIFQKLQDSVYKVRKTNIIILWHAIYEIYNAHIRILCVWCMKIY